MQKKDLERVLSLLLAAQMLCAPLTTAALAAGPVDLFGDGSVEASIPMPEPSPEEDAMEEPAGGPSGEELPPEEPETPVVSPEPDREEPEEATDVVTSLLDAPPLPPDYTRGLKLSYGNQATYIPKWKTIPSGQFNGYFAVEMPAVSQQYGRAPNMGFSRTDSTPANYYYPFAFFPSQEDLGRLPDMKFDDWYTYVWETAGDVYKWVYQEDKSNESQKITHTEYQGSLNEEYLYNCSAEDWASYKEGKQWTGLIQEAYPGPMAEGTLQIVGRWVPSDIAAAREGGVTLKAGGTGDLLPLYETPIAGVATSALAAVDFDPDAENPQAKEYYLRVDADVESIDLSFLAVEPYFNYHMASAEEKANLTPPVTVSVKAPGQEVATPLTGDALTSKMTPEAQKVPDTEYYGYDYHPQNSCADPASSLWTANGIPLKTSAGAGKYYNDIGVSVTSPDGQHTKTYIFHIQRMAEPELALAPGNTPYGMVIRDSSETLNKETVWNRFLENNRAFVFGENLFPMDSEHNNEGFLYHGSYGKAAWGTEKDYDCSQTAIVVYQNRAFQDPGLTLKDSQGDLVHFGTTGAEAYRESLQRSVVLRWKSDLSAEDFGADVGKERYYYDKMLWETAGNAEKEYEIICNADGSDTIDLSGLHVLPGIYSIEYRYTDPVNGKVYDSTGESYTEAAKERADSFSRALVVLPIPGDVNMDGVVNLSDAKALEEHMVLGTDDNILTYDNKVVSSDPQLSVAVYRAMDVTGDGKVNKDDVTALRTTFVNKLDRNMSGGPDSKDGATYFYLPLPDGGVQTTARVDLSAPEENGEGRAALRLSFLGKETGRVGNGGVYTTVTGPRTNANPSDAKEAIELGDVFWVGVQLDATNQAALNQIIEELRLTLAYDSRYVAPATVLTQTDMSNMGAAATDPVARWEYTLTLYNVDQTKAKTPWVGSYLLGAGSVQSATPALHLDRGATSLELSAGSTYSEMVFSISKVNQQPGASLEKGGWLLMVPFQLIRHPYGETAPTLVELAAGSRELALTGAQYNGAFRAQGGALLGCKAINLRNSLYFPAGLGMSLHLGEDKTEAKTLYNQTHGENSTTNGVYGEEFFNKTASSGADEDAVNSALPQGLTYDANTGIISGTPEKAGEFVFVVKTAHFRIFIEQAELRYFAESRKRYYGETMLHNPMTNTNDAEITYRYYSADLKAPDLKRVAESNGALSNSGRGEDLQGVLGLEDKELRQPKFQVYDDQGKPVTRLTDVGTYEIAMTIPPLTNNYKFTFVEIDDRHETVDGKPNELEILPRPIYVQDFRENFIAGTIFDDDSPLVSGAETSTKTGDVILAVPQDPGSSETVYEKRWLDGDALADPSQVLTLIYSAVYVQNTDDKRVDGEGNGKRFYLEEFSEERDVTLGTVKLPTNDPVAANYWIAGQTDHVVTVKGIVTRRVPTAITIHSLPKLSYAYGEKMDITQTNSLNIEVFSGSGSNATTSGPVTYNEKTYGDMYVNVCWVKVHLEENETIKDVDIDDIDFEGGLTFQKNEPMTVADHDGRYLCVWTWAEREENKPGGGTETVKTRVYALSEEPVRVTPKTVVLTADPQERFYGEENPELTFTFAIEDLAVHDREGLTGKIGTGEDLAKAMGGYGYKPPKLEARKTASTTGEILQPNTPYTIGVEQYVVISGAFAHNYQFLYARKGGEPNEEFGYNSFAIHQRPIVVQSVEPSSDRGDELTIYADTYTPALSGLKLAASEFKMMLPEGYTETSMSYYPAGGTGPGGPPKTMEIGYAQKDAIYQGDELGLTCKVRFVRDNDVWTSDLTTNYFDLSGAEGGSKSYPLEVCDLELTGAAANNYVLVYSRNDDAERKGVYSRNLVEQTYSSGRTDFYYVAQKADGSNLTGTVVLRPIRAIRIVALPKMDYTYGMRFSARFEGSQGKPLTVAVEYDNHYENDPVNNIREEQVIFRGTNFSDRGLTLLYLPEGEDYADKEALQELLEGTYVTPGEHHNARLVVSGRRAEVGETVYSVPDASKESLLTVEKKTLTLFVDTMYRYYGERNEDYGFTFRLEDLAEPDQEALKDAALTGRAAATEGGTSQPATSVALTAIDGTYVGPRFTTEAKSSTPVKNAGYGGYDLTLSGGSMANYTFAYQNSLVYIYRRPIQVTGVSSAEQNPIYTIYSDTITTTTFYQNADSQRVSAQVPAIRWDNSTADPAWASVPTDKRNMSLSSSAIRSGDLVQYTLEVNFYQFKPGDDLKGQSGKAHKVTVEKPVLTNGYPVNDNYCLLDSQVTKIENVWGRVELRQITGIKLLTGMSGQSTLKLDYTYGEALDLDGLWVEITYKTIDGVEEGQTAIVKYEDGRQAAFNEQGLYVHYYSSDNGTPPPQSEWGDLIETGRVADTGDHLTIAPSHDDPKFRHNGKYLVVSAQRHKDQAPVEPKMVAAPLSVVPLALTYTLEAADKTYDHKTEGAGTLTLTNAYNKPGYVDAYNQNGVTDVVFVSTGADYETPVGGTTYDKYGDFLTHVGQKGYAFTTGVYEPKIYTNGLTYNGGYDRSQHLSFQFTNPNVAYQGPTDRHTWGELAEIPVEVTNIKLSGPDAANYTITPAVETDDPVAGYEGTGRPKATIQKADRKPLDTDLPGLELDIHTNVLRLVYKTSPEDVKDPEDEMGGYFDFEYALQSVAAGDDYTLSHVAGKKGTDQYQDTFFFGGEAVTPGWPEGYEPDPSKLPDEVKENDIIKGQVYGWATEDTGFTQDTEAYPGGLPYPGYELYKNSRLPLARDTVYWGLVRVAETHNYKASPPLSTVEGMEANVIQAAIDGAEGVKAAQKALDGAVFDEDVAAAEAALAQAKIAASSAAQALYGQGAQAVDGAKADAQARAEALAEIGETGKWPDKDQEIEAVPPAQAVKTYRQRIDLISTQEDRGMGQGAVGVSENYTVPTLEAVWFTDLMIYEKKDYLDAVVGNHDPSRYYGYYWDVDRSAELKFDKDNILNLEESPFEVEVTRKDENGQSEKVMVPVNENHTAVLHVNTQGGGGGILENTIRIEPRTLTAYLGDEPVQLSVIFDPLYVTVKTVSWSSSDRKVATVDRRGVVTFVGVGETTITAVSSAGRRDSITVTVLHPAARDSQYPDSLLNREYQGSLFELREDLLFYPDQPVTRGELAVLLARLYRENPNRPVVAADVSFPDVTEGAEYAQAIKLLAEYGIITGVEDGTFAGDRVATRAEMVTMLARMLGIPPEGNLDGPHAFSDTGPKDTWAWAYIDALATNGVLKGVGDGSFAPGRVLTRSEAAAFVVRLLNQTALPEGLRPLIPVDVPEDHWGFRAIVRAVNSAPAQPPERK